MKLVRWTRFTWDLGRLPSTGEKPSAGYQIRPIVKGDERMVRDVIVSAFSLNMDWADMLKVMEERLGSELDQVFEGKEPFGLVMTNGSRVIGASAIDFNSESENNLVSGPTLVVEYHNRGLGSTLLHQSLLMLRDHGLTTARGVTKNNSPAAKFLYPKFGSVAEAWDYEPQLVGSD